MYLDIGSCDDESFRLERKKKTDILRLLVLLYTDSFTIRIIAFFSINRLCEVHVGGIIFHQTQAKFLLAGSKHTENGVPSLGWVICYGPMNRRKTCSESDPNDKFMEMNG